MNDLFNGLVKQHPKTWMLIAFGVGILAGFWVRGWF